MRQIKDYNFIVDRTPLSAEANMQKDRELFENFKGNAPPVFRLYRWEESFTYGVSQKMEELEFSYGKSSAKRITGGGILLHGHDISYSIICSNDFIVGKSVKEGYEYLCGFLMDFYRSLGLKPSFAKDLKDITLSKSGFCQVGFEPYDIIIKGKKIGGNAQKRARDKLLQHGSIPIKKINHPQGGYSLEDLGVCLSYDEATDMLLESFKGFMRKNSKKETDI